MRKYKLNLARVVFIAVCLIAGIGIRAILFLNPAYKHLTYDEAVPGLMAMDMLEGVFTPFYWGAPYLGTLESMTAAVFFKIAGASAFLMRCSPFLLSLLFAFCFICLASRINNNQFSLLALLYISLPPLAFHEYALSPMGGYMHTLAIGAVIILYTAGISDRKSHFKSKDVAIISFISGIGFWNFMMILPFIAAAFLEIIYKNRSQKIRTMIIYIISFIIGSLPFWLANISNGFYTFTAKVKGAEAESLSENFINLTQVFLEVMGRTTELSSSSLPVSLLIYPIPLIILLFLVMSGKQLLRNSAFRLISISLLLFSLAFVAGEHGEKVLSRYGLPFYATISVLIIAAMEKAAKISKLLFILSIIYIISMNSPYVISFIQENYSKKREFSPDKLISFLQQEKITHLTGHYTVTQPLTFSSGKTILAADFNGFRNIEYLKLYDQSENNALVTHYLLPFPHPEAMEKRLRTLFHSFRKKRIADYVLFYDFQPLPQGISLPTDEIKSMQNKGKDMKPLLTDRVFGTRLTVRDISLKIILKKTHKLSRIMISSGVENHTIPNKISISTETNGKVKQILQSEELTDTFTEINSSVKYIPDGFIDLRFPSQTTDNLIIKIESKLPFNLDEIIIYENNKQESRKNTKPADSNFLLLDENQAPFNRGNTSIRLYDEHQLYTDNYREWNFTKRSFSPSKIKKINILSPQLKNPFISVLQRYNFNPLITDNIIYPCKNENRKEYYISPVSDSCYSAEASLIIKNPEKSNLYGLMIKNLKTLPPLPDKITLHSKPASESKSEFAAFADPLLYQRGGEFFRMTTDESFYYFTEPIDSEKIILQIAPEGFNFRQIFLLSDEKFLCKKRQNKTSIYTGPAGNTLYVSHLSLSDNNFYSELQLSVKNLHKSNPINLFFHLINEKEQIVFQHDLTLPSVKNYQGKLVIPIPYDISVKGHARRIGFYDLTEKKRCKLQPKDKYPQRAILLQTNKKS